MTSPFNLRGRLPSSEPGGEALMVDLHVDIDTLDVAPPDPGATR